MMFLLLILLSFIAYKIYIKRYNKKKRPYLIENLALSIIDGADLKTQTEALKQVYKRSKNKKTVAKFNRLVAKEIYFIQLENMKKESENVK